MMLAHRLEATVSHNRTLTLENLPFHSGEQVEIIILSRSDKVPQQSRNSLQGTVIQYIEPMEPIDQNDWEVAQ
jgi:hypothetical protein